VLARGGHVSIEWPRGCAYWSWDCVRTFIARNNLVWFDLDGCAVDIVSRVSGLPIKKPWRIATTSTHLVPLGSMHRCPGKDEHPVHAPCAGSDTKQTENYSDLFAWVVHASFMHQVACDREETFDCIVDCPMQFNANYCLDACACKPECGHCGCTHEYGTCERRAPCGAVRCGACGAGCGVACGAVCGCSGGVSPALSDSCLPCLHSARPDRTGAMAAPASAAVPPRGADPGEVAGAAAAAADPQVEAVLKRAKFELAQDSSEAAGVGTAPPQPDAVPEPKAPRPSSHHLRRLTLRVRRLRRSFLQALLTTHLRQSLRVRSLCQSLRAHSRSLPPLSA